MASQSPQADSANAGALLLLSTEQKVHAYDLSQFSRVGIGRHESNEIQLASRTVSNFHAEILKENGILVVRDLGSTNGTQVNGERVERIPVSPGDRIRIGNHVLSLQLQAPREGESGSARSGGFGPGARGRLLGFKARPAEGSLDLPLTDLMRRLSARPESLRVVVERDGAKAELLFHLQRLIHVGYLTAVGEKALYRLFGWQEGTYEIQLLENAATATVSICLPLEALLVEGMDQALELGKLAAGLPPLSTPLRLKEDCPLPLTAHSPAEIEIFQAIIRHETIAMVLEKSPWTDLRVLRLIASLLEKGVFEIGSLNGLDETCSIL